MFVTMRQPLDGLAAAQGAASKSRRRLGPKSGKGSGKGSGKNPLKDPAEAGDETRLETV